MELFDIKTGQLKTFKPLVENEVSMYVCGPTVYSDIHIGNARPVVFFDVVAQYFRSIGYQVKYVSNITDVDDKIINRAIEEGVDEATVVDAYARAFLAVCDSLGVRAVKRMEATKSIQAMITVIEQLIEKGIAYESNGDVYFRVAKIADYGVLSHQTVEELEVGARIEENMAKEHPVDFTLWKATKEGIRWSSPWSEGRPGWHTECATMIKEAFGQTIDIHGGGMDLKFPHHENERAHAKGLGWDELANVWMHNGFVEINEGKMSKSSGEIVLAKDVVEQYGKNATRYWLLSSHYRQPLVYSDEVLTAAAELMTKMNDSVADAASQLQLQNYPVQVTLTSPAVLSLEKEFHGSMSMDMNTANALSVMHEISKQINIHLRHGEKSFGVLSQYLTLLLNISGVLGIEFDYPTITEEDRKLVAEWRIAKSEKDYTLADKIRNTLQERNIKVR